MFALAMEAGFSRADASDGARIPATGMNMFESRRIGSPRQIEPV
jgi:hypothetical protein